MEKFTASDGVTVVVPLDDGGVDVGVTRGKWDRIDARFVPALREFFQAERDKELGRWRWTENPDYVVYGREHDIWVFDEREEQGQVYYRDDDFGSADGLRARAAEAYFAAHPEPKPWHAAKAGEVWLITDDRQKVFEMTCVEGDTGLEFFTHHRMHSVRYPGITAARRIWPEQVSDG